MQQLSPSLYLLIFSLAFACQGAEKSSGDLSTPSQPSTNLPTTEVESSEGVVGPDDAFFAENYLESVFEYSHQNPIPDLSQATALTESSRPTGGFDFTANFSEKRLALMSRGIFLIGDADGDNFLSESEFSSLKLDPSSFGVEGSSVSHALSSQIFMNFAGADALLSPGETRKLFRDLGPVIKTFVDRNSPHEQRLKLIKSWEKVLARYDADKNGKLSFQEQQMLRQDRAELLNQVNE
ncbi:MAG: hypothetical protein NTX25_07870 [Proteobacteria bacterium]|nr:hypothetical protein [Pseudomonadota bacterium]